MKNYKELADSISDLSEDEGYRLFMALKDRFGWAGTVLGKPDVEELYTRVFETEGGMPDEEWNKVLNHYDWIHLSEILNESGMEIIQTTLENILVENGRADWEALLAANPELRAAIEAEKRRRERDK